jgi:hypothetical protein
MPLEQTEIIDEIVPPNEEQKIGLVVADSGSVTEPKRRLNLLKKKIEHYLEAAMEGAVHPRYRYTDPNDFYIEVVCARPPTRQMLQIKEVARNGDTKHILKVNYREAQNGVWSEAGPADAATPIEGLTTDSLDALISAAFDAGHNCLRAGETPSLLLFVQNAQAYLVSMEEFESDEEVAPALADWAAGNTSGVSACVLVRLASCQIDARQTNALVGHVLQAGAKEGLILAQQLYEDNGFFHGSGTLLFLGCCQNPLIGSR